MTCSEISHMLGDNENRVHLLQLVFPFLESQVHPHSRVLARKLLDLSTIQVVQQPRVDLSWELGKVSPKLKRLMARLPGRRTGRAARC